MNIHGCMIDAYTASPLDLGRMLIEQRVIRHIKRGTLEIPVLRCTIRIGDAFHRVEIEGDKVQVLEIKSSLVELSID